MPYKCEKDSIPFELKRSSKISLKDKELLIEMRKKFGTSYAKLGKEFGVSKSLAIFIVNPERAKRNYQLRVARGGSKLYYNKEKHTEAIREYRRRKKKLSDEGKLIIKEGE